MSRLGRSSADRRVRKRPNVHAAKTAAMTQVAIAIALLWALAANLGGKSADAATPEEIREVLFSSEARTRHLQLPVNELRSSFGPYTAYCQRFPEHCNLSGPSIIPVSSHTGLLLHAVNADANRSIQNARDMDLYGREEFWAFPSHGAGDCEDIALFKREQLVRLGLPRAAMTIAIVHHKREMFPHAVLLVETTAGTYLLDNLANEIVVWHEAPYNFEARERPDGSWERFDQSNWLYE